MLKFIIKNKVLLAITAIVIVCLIVLSAVLVSYFSNNEEIVKVEKEEEYFEESGESTETLHHHYTPEIEDPFKEAGSATISDFVLGTPEIHKGSMNEGSGAVLNAAAKNTLLISSYGRNLYTYDLKKKEVFIVERNVTYGNLDEESNYILYTRSVDGGQKRDINILETKDRDRQKVGELETGLEMKNSVFYKDMFVYVASDLLEEKKVTGVVKANQDLDDNNVEKMKSIVNQYEFKEFKTYKEKLYGYSQKEKAIFALENDKWNKKIDIPSEILIDFSISEGSYYLNYTDLENTYYTINGEQVAELKGAYDSMWLDENNLLVVVNSNLHLYNLKEKKLEPILHAVNSVFADGDYIYVQDLEQNTIVKTIEILNK